MEKRRNRKNNKNNKHQKLLNYDTKNKEIAKLDIPTLTIVEDNQSPKNTNAPLS